MKAADTKYAAELAIFQPLYTQPLGRFLQEVENGKPRFIFWHNRSPRLNDCSFINPAAIG